MRDFENDNLNPQHDDQTPKNEWEAPRADEEKPSEEPQKESPMREEPFRDIYGHTYVPKEPPKPPKKKRSEVKMSGGAPAMPPRLKTKPACMTMSSIVPCSCAT